VFKEERIWICSRALSLLRFGLLPLVPFPCEEIFGDGYGQRGSHFSGFHGQVRIAFSSSHIAVSGLGFGSEFEVCWMGWDQSGGLGGYGKAERPEPGGVSTRAW
jgi:hypothetical protein